jgi:hypothetical protein
MTKKLVEAYLKLTDDWSTTKELGVTIHQMRTLESMGLVESTRGALRPYEPHYGWRRTGAREVRGRGCETRRFFAVLQRIQSSDREILLGRKPKQRASPKTGRRKQDRGGIEERQDPGIQGSLSDTAILAEVRIKVEEALTKVPTQNLARDLAIILDIPRNTQPL